MDILSFLLYFLIMAGQSFQQYSRYLSAEPDALRWGLHVLDCGHSTVPPDVDYSAISSEWPAGYALSWQRGRTLQEYQLYYIAEGRGVFESEPTGLKRVLPGDVFLLFPGVWHRFRPIRAEGWSESWIGFGGEVADQIMQTFFSPDNPVLKVGYSDELLSLVQSVSGLMDHAQPGYQQIMGARAMAVLAEVRSRAMRHHPRRGKAARKVAQARRHLAEHYYHTVDLAELAGRLGLSYPRFRALFKEHTGLSPHQYQLEVRMNLARHWLTESDQSLDRIAFGLGFKSTAYFSRIFKKKVGCPPGAYRKR